MKKKKLLEDNFIFYLNLLILNILVFKYENIKPSKHTYCNSFLNQNKVYTT